MLDIKLLNSDAQLNNFQVLGSLAYVPGENFRVVVRLFLSQLDIRYIPDAGATYEFTFKTKSGTDLVIAATELDALDRSILYVDLTTTQTMDIIGSNFTVTVTEGSDVKKGVAQNVLEKTLIDGNC